MPNPELTTTEKLQTAWVKGKERLVEGEKRVEHYVVEHPVKSVLIAVGAGVALGWLLGRKH